MEHLIQKGEMSQKCSAYTHCWQGARNLL